MAFLLQLLKLMGGINNLIARAFYFKEMLPGKAFIRFKCETHF